jgi:hypothetical protein
MNTPTADARRLQTTEGMNVVALAGRRIDAADAEVARFPLDHARAVQERIRAVLQETQAAVLVCSAACGADLLALEAARELGLGVHVILPFGRERFRQTSVVDRPGDWGQIFDRQVKAAEIDGTLYELRPGPDSHEAYLRAATAILDQAADCARRTPSGQYAGTCGHITALVVWDGQSRGPRDITEAFLQRADARKITVRHISTN